MAPVNQVDLHSLFRRMPNPVPEPSTRTSPPTRSSMTSEGGFLEAWAQGYNVGSLIILILIVFCNYRSGIWLHKFILLELVLALWHGTFIFFDDPVYGWYLSATATLLFVSYFLHNIVSWLKIRPFLPVWGSRAFIISLLCVQPFWIAEAWSNFSYFNGLGSTVNIQMRPWEALLRDPWWIFTTWKLIDAIKKTYNYRLLALIRINSRFGVMLACMFISIAFLVTDVIISAAKISASSGINPYWRFALVFKCASDTIFLDDFKSVLDEIMARKFSSEHGTVHRGSVPGSGRDSSGHKRSHSGVRRTDMVDCSSLAANPYSVPMATDIYSPQAMATSRSRYVNPFARKDKRAEPPRIHVQKETTVTSESRHSSTNGWNSESEMLPKPENAVYGSANTKRNHGTGSEGSLLIGRLGVDV